MLDVLGAKDLLLAIDVGEVRVEFHGFGESGSLGHFEVLVGFDLAIQRSW